jgi:hypothetical protein
MGGSAIDWRRGHTSKFAIALLEESAHRHPGEGLAALRVADEKIGGSRPPELPRPEVLGLDDLLNHVGSKDPGLEKWEARRFLRRGRGVVVEQVRQ